MTLDGLYVENNFLRTENQQLKSDIKKQYEYICTLKEKIVHGNIIWKKWTGETSFTATWLPLVNDLAFTNPQDYRKKYEPVNLGAYSE